MLIDLQTLEEVRVKLMDLGRTVSSLSGDIKGSVQDVHTSLRDIQRSLESAVDPVAIKNVSKASEEISKISGQYAEYLDQFEGTFGNMDSFGSALGTASQKFENLAKDIDNIASGPAASEPTQQALSSEKAKKQRPKQSHTNLLQKEVSSARGKIRGMLSALKIPAIGAVSAGAIAWMAYGFQEKDRLRAQSGEAMNIMVAAFDGMTKDLVRKGTAYVASFQETMQKFYGISKEEVQSVAKAFVDGGISIEEMLSGFDKKFGMVGKNFISFSLGMDKMYELAGGTTAQRMVKYAKDYGKSMDEAKNTVERLYFLGQESGLGAQSFVDIIEKSGDSLKKLGFSIDAVAELAVKMQDSFKKIGVPKRFAGRQIALGLDQMASGIANMSEGWQSLVAEKMGYGEGLEGRQRLLEASTRVAEGDTAEETEKFIVTTVNTVMQAVQGDAVRSRYILEKDLGFGFEGARIAKMIADAANAGDRQKAKEITKKYRKQISDSLLTERQKQSKFQRHMNEWMKGLADIGQGLLGYATNFLASLLAFFKSIPAFFGNLFKKDADERNADLMERILSFQKGNDKYKNLIMGGLGKLKESGMAMGKDVMGPSLDNLQKAMELQPYQRSSASKPTMATPSRRRQAEMPDVPSTVKMVPIPISQPGVYEAGTPEEKYDSLLSKVSAYTRDIGEDPWVGGELNILSQGVDEQGNIRVGLVGNCPKCGLRFGEGFDLSSYQDATRALKSGEVEVINPNTGRSVAVDPTTKSGMEALSQVGRGRKSRKAGVEGSMDPKLGRIIKQISERFPDRRIQIYSGHREGEKGQHGKGTAMDIGVEGVSTKDLFRFLRSNVKGGGKGYYPEQPFIHIDTRPGTAVWVDPSKKGEHAKSLGGAAANAWLNKNVGWEKGSETSKRYEDKGPAQSMAYDVDIAPQQTVME